MLDFFQLHFLWPFVQLILTTSILAEKFIAFDNPKVSQYKI